MSINPEQNASAAFGGPDVTAVPDEFLDGGETLMLDELRIEVLKTPGHSRGGVCFYIPDQYTLFSGDTLFCGGYGRCDLYGGDYAALMRSLSELMRLPEQCRVYPGHGGETTILREKTGGLI